MEAKKPLFKVGCGRCGGTGIWTKFHGQCFACRGTGCRWVKTDPAVTEANRKKAWERTLKRNEEARQKAAALDTQKGK